MHSKNKTINEKIQEKDIAEFDVKIKVKTFILHFRHVRNSETIL